MSTGFLGLPTALELSRDSLRRIATVINGILAGKQNNVTTVTLTASSATTTFNDPRIGAGSHLAFTPLTANAMLARNGQGGLLNIQVFATPTAGTTYTATTGTDFVVVEVIGGGASASGSGATAVGAFSCTSGGGGGGYARKLISSNFSGKTVIVGAGGSAPTAGSNGSAGNASKFDAAGYNMVANGGGNGNYIANAATGTFSAVGGIGGTASGGDVNASGCFGGLAFASPASGFNQCFGGFGAGGYMGLGGGIPGSVIAATSKAAGAAGTVYGAGGGGSAATGGQTAQSAGAGADGAVLIWEYSYGGVGGLYVSSRGKQTATLTHANNSQSDRTFSVEITG